MADSIGGLAVPVSVDFSKFESGIASVNKTIDRLATGPAVKMPVQVAPPTGGINLAGITQSLGSMVPGANSVTSALGGVTSKLGSIVGMVPGLGFAQSAITALTSPAGMVAAALAGVVLYGAKAIHQIADLNDTALKLGVTAVELQEMQYAMGKFGLSSEVAEGTIAKLRAKLGDLAAGDAAAGAAFARLGLDKAALAGKSTSEAMGMISDKLKGITDNNVRASIAMDIFGKQWSEIEEFALKGSEAYAEAARQAQRYGVVLSNDVVASIEETSDATDAMLTAWGTIGTFTRNTVAQMVQPIMDAINPILVKVRDAIQPVLSVVGKVAIAIGKVIGVVFDAIGAVVGPIIDAIGFIFNIIEGAISSIGKVWDWLKGAATGAWGWVKDKASGTWDWIKDKAGGVLSWIDSKSGGFFSWVGDKIGGAWDWMKEKAGGAWDWIKDKAKGAWEWIKNIAGFGESDFDKQNQAIWDAMEAVSPKAPSSEMKNAIEETTLALMEQAQTFGMSQREIDRWRLSMQLADQGLSQSQIDEQLAGIDFFMETIDRYQLEADINKTADTLQEQIDTFGMSAQEIERYRLQMRGASDEDLAFIDVLNEELRQLREKQKEMEEFASWLDSLQSEADKVAESVKSPLEKFNEEFDKLQELFAMGLISADQYALAVEKAMDQLDRGQDMTLPGSPTVALQGSSAAYSAILAANRTANQRPEDPAQRTARLMEQANQQRNQQITVARDTLDAVRQQKNLPPVYKGL
ncbi:MAG: hypothetical protein U0744_02610 [Gemmataceae bacterium]